MTALNHILSRHADIHRWRNKSKFRFRRDIPDLIEKTIQYPDTVTSNGRRKRTSYIKRFNYPVGFDMKKNGKKSTCTM